MKAHTLRNAFLDFFVKHKKLPHTEITSSSLIPAQDTSVLFTTAGMQQFKPYFLNNKAQAQKDLGAVRFTSSQKCFRVSDIDEVGDPSHLTFFEMLGNFSVGDYFKEEAIRLALEFVTKKLKLNKEKIWITIFSGDADAGLAVDVETKKIWLSCGIPEERIIVRGREDNFWGPPGTVGPCGPCTEMYYPRESGLDVTSFDEAALLEIWNIVFMEYEKKSDGSYVELDQKNIDTGMGLERTALITEHVHTVYETSLLRPLLEVIEQDPSFVPDEQNHRRLRIAADHLRATAFLLSENVTFGKKEQQAILRRIFRKACDQFKERHPDFPKIVDCIVSLYGKAYPQLKEGQQSILYAIQEEFEMYTKVRERKVDLYLKKIRHQDVVSSQQEPLKGPSIRTLEAEEAFQLFATYGFTLEHLQEEGYQFDIQSVQKKIHQHKELSKQGAEKKFGGHGLDTVGSAAMPEEARIAITRLHTATHLLHSSLRAVLGDTVTQQGSDINPERLRFDFSFSRKLTDEEKNKVEQRVNGAIASGYEVVPEEMPYAEAIKKGALAFFREKYPEHVSVYSVRDKETKEVFSMELCGGPHVKNTSELGTFTISSEKSIAKGIRRIKAILT